MTVAFSSALPSTDYRVSVAITSIAGFAANSVCGVVPDVDGCYFIAVTAKTTTGFTLSLRSPQDGSLENASPGAITLDWIAIANQ